jgi:hypothetical protein
VSPIGRHSGSWAAGFRAAGALGVSPIGRHSGPWAAGFRVTETEILLAK